MQSLREVGLAMAELVYPPVIRVAKAFWRYLGLQFTIQGESNIPRRGSAIMAINHIGYLDFAIAGTAALPSHRLVRFMAKKEIFSHPIAGPLMRGMKHISVDRNNGSPSFTAALKALHRGEIVGVFPEATISRSFELKEMKSGVIRLAMESGAPILPTVLWGSQRLWTKGLPRNFSRRHVPIMISVGEPMPISKNASIETSLNELKERMYALLTQAQNDYPDSPVNQRWAPARLGGTAPTIEMIAKESARRKEI
jgi:1-acyl-sn-glycerol-3-phosphate acyltransferase